MKRKQSLKIFRENWVEKKVKGVAPNIRPRFSNYGNPVLCLPPIEPPRWSTSPCNTILPLRSTDETWGPKVIIRILLLGHWSHPFVYFIDDKHRDSFIDWHPLFISCCLLLINCWLNVFRWGSTALLAPLSSSAMPTFSSSPPLDYWSNVYDPHHHQLHQSPDRPTIHSTFCHHQLLGAYFFTNRPNLHFIPFRNSLAARY